MEYTIVISKGGISLQKAVNEHIKKGWEPQGGVFIRDERYNYKFFQAMIKNKDK